MLILFPNSLTGSNEMDTETSELTSLVTTSYFTFHLQIKIQLKADICCPSSSENLCLPKA